MSLNFTYRKISVADILLKVINVNGNLNKIFKQHASVLEEHYRTNNLQKRPKQIYIQIFCVFSV